MAKDFRDLSELEQELLEAELIVAYARRERALAAVHELFKVRDARGEYRRITTLGLMSATELLDVLNKFSPGPKSRGH